MLIAQSDSPQATNPKKFKFPQIQNTRINTKTNIYV